MFVSTYALASPKAKTHSLWTSCARFTLRIRFRERESTRCIDALKKTRRLLVKRGRASSSKANKTRAGLLLKRGGWLLKKVGRAFKKLKWAKSPIANR